MGQKTDPKQKDGKMIDITGKAAARTEPVKKPAAPEKAAKAEKPGKAKPASKSPPVKTELPQFVRTIQKAPEM